MINDRYYYLSLNDKSRIIYKTIYSGITSFAPSICIGIVEDKELNRIIDGILLDNPHIFYLDFRSYTYCKSLTSITIFFTYLCVRQEMESIKIRIEEIVKAFLISENVADQLDYQKEILIHDYLCKSVKYDIRCQQNIEENMKSHTMWGAFLEKKAVCDGIAKAFKYICNAVGIKCIVVKGRGNNGKEEEHAWNIVKLDGKSYQVDVTWDLNAFDGENYSYQYLNLPDNMMLLDHRTTYRYPKCDSTFYTYLIREKQVFYNKESFIMYITDCLLHRKKVIDYRLILGNSSKSSSKIIEECYKEAIQKAYISNVTIKMELNAAQGCGRLRFEYGTKRGHSNAQNVFNYDLLDGHGFEFFCADLLRYNGFENIQVTSGSGDFGVDILCEYKSVPYAIQCKCYSNVVGNKAVQEVFSGKEFYKCGKAVVITNSYFTASAEETARMTKVELWDRGRLNELYRIACSRGFVPRKY